MQRARIAPNEQRRPADEAPQFGEREILSGNDRGVLPRAQTGTGGETDSFGGVGLRRA
jgi:hypothetical protein